METKNQFDTLVRVFDDKVEVISVRENTSKNGVDFYDCC